MDYYNAMFIILGLLLFSTSVFAFNDDQNEFILTDSEGTYNDKFDHDFEDNKYVSKKGVRSSSNLISPSSLPWKTRVVLSSSSPKIEGTSTSVNLTNIRYIPPSGSQRLLPMKFQSPNRSMVLKGIRKNKTTSEKSKFSGRIHKKKTNNRRFQIGNAQLETEMKVILINKTSITEKQRSNKDDQSQFPDMKRVQQKFDKGSKANMLNSSRFINHLNMKAMVDLMLQKDVVIARKEAEKNYRKVDLSKPIAVNIWPKPQDMNIPSEHRRMNISSELRDENISSELRHVNISSEPRHVNISSKSNDVNISSTADTHLNIEKKKAAKISKKADMSNPNDADILSSDRTNFHESDIDDATKGNTKILKFYGKVALPFKDTDLLKNKKVKAGIDDDNN